MLENTISDISYLLDIHSIFTCSIIVVLGRRLSFPPLCQHATFIYCSKYANTYTGKAFVGTRGGGRERYAIKLVLISIYFNVKKHSFCPKLSPCSSQNEKLNSQNTEFKKTFS